MGTAIGRYPEDVYDGVGFSGGNPWYLATLAFAELNYHAAYEFKQSGQIAITEKNRIFFERLPTFQGKGVNAGTVIHKQDPQFQSVISDMIASGDSYIERVKFHMPADGSMAEQFERTSGYARGAKDLTWSYKSFLSAIEKRRLVAQ